MKPNLEALKRFKFIPVWVVPANGPAFDEGERVYVQGELPEYLKVKEVFGADALNLVRSRADDRPSWEGEALFNFLVPCDRNCQTLADPVHPGCNALHISAQNPSLKVAELRAIGARIATNEHIFFNNTDSVKIYIYSDGSVGMEDYLDRDSPPEAFRDIAAFIRKHIFTLADAPAGSALQKFRLHCAEYHIDQYFESFLPGGIAA
ncbi:MAG: hypothetical protein LH614_17160 [Pyrinomonadaceae bacterium]|nr:hypothetical protein [Pyrinomonadaceae bacterium]